MNPLDDAVEAAVAECRLAYARLYAGGRNDELCEILAQVALEAGKPFMHRVVPNGDGLLPGTVVEDKTGDVLKLMETGEWWATDDAGPSYVEYPATVLLESDINND